MEQFSVTGRNIIKEFPAGDEVIQVLHGVDINVPTGKLSMLVGPSGCGKTTLISILTGILSATSGEINVHGTRLDTLSDNEKVLFRRNEFGFIFQQYNLLSSLTAVENAAVVLVAGGMKLSEAQERATAILEKMNMQEHLHKLPSQLSGGQQQRIAIARALAHEPKLVVCDEPTASLDAHSGQTVMEILSGIVLQPGRAVLVVTHDNRIFHFADRIFYMDDGTIDRVENPKENAS